MKKVSSFLYRLNSVMRTDVNILYLIKAAENDSEMDVTRFFVTNI